VLFRKKTSAPSINVSGRPSKAAKSTPQSTPKATAASHSTPSKIRSSPQSLSTRRSIAAVALAVAVVPLRRRPHSRQSHCISKSNNNPHRKRPTVSTCPHLAPKAPPSLLTKCPSKATWPPRPTTITTTNIISIITVIATTTTMMTPTMTTRMTTRRAVSPTRPSPSPTRSQWSRLKKRPRLRATPRLSTLAKAHMIT